MIGDAVVIDGVVHGYHSPPETYTHPISPLVVESLYHGYHRVFSPRGDKRWLLDRERFARVDADLLDAPAPNGPDLAEPWSGGALS